MDIFLNQLIQFYSNNTTDIHHLTPHYYVTFSVQQAIAPGAARRYAPAYGSSTVAKIAADLRLSPGGSAVRTSLVAGGG